MLDWIRALAPRARYCVAIGSCAAFGGIPAAAPGPTDARGLQYLGGDPGGALGAEYVSLSGLPVVNISGCAPHPGWIMETLLALSLGVFDRADMDSLGRPRLSRIIRASRMRPQRVLRIQGERRKLLRTRVPDGESRLQGDAGLFGDCNQRSWNGGGSCTQAGSTCIACTSPSFQNTRGFLRTPKLAGIPIGLPSICPRPGSSLSPLCRNRRL